MKTSIKFQYYIIAILSCLFLSCEDYLDIGTPDNKIVSKTVFSSDETANSAMQGIYNQLASGFSGGGGNSVSILCELSSNNLSTINSTLFELVEIEEHEISPANNRNLNLWASAYKIIYMSNSLLEGLANSEVISEEVSRRLEGESKFIRAFSYFYLVNLYGEVPLILTTDYVANSLASRVPVIQIYQQIVSDLEDSINLLEDGYFDEGRTRANKGSALSLMARVQLYLKNWQQAENYSSLVINQSSTYEILEDLNKVFLANSREAIWQISPIGRGNGFTNTNEGSFLIIDPFLSFLAQVSLRDTFPESFKKEDKRLQNWIGFHSGTGKYYSHKYKIRNSTTDLSEFSMVLRLSEQYLIRAEARAMLGDISNAIGDLNKIRTRAGIEPLELNSLKIGKEELLDLILEERNKELFTEWGHRWLDLKRMDKINDTLISINPFWETSDHLYPIPESERMNNSNLSQNPGY